MKQGMARGSFEVVSMVSLECGFAEREANALPASSPIYETMGYKTPRTQGHLGEKTTRPVLFPGGETLLQARLTKDKADSSHLV